MKFVRACMYVFCLSFIQIIDFNKSINKMNKYNL